MAERVFLSVEILHAELQQPVESPYHVGKRILAVSQLVIVGDSRRSIAERIHIIAHETIDRRRVKIVAPVVLQSQYTPPGEGFFETTGAIHVGHEVEPQIAVFLDIARYTLAALHHSVDYRLAERCRTCQFQSPAESVLVTVFDKISVCQHTSDSRKPEMVERIE